MPERHKEIEDDAELSQENAECMPFRHEVLDRVFRIGGSNPFNDKAKAIWEVTRGAKPCIVIMIGDERARLERNYSGLPLVGKEFRNTASMMKHSLNWRPKRCSIPDLGTSAGPSTSSRS